MSVTDPDVSISYNNAEIATLSDSGTKTLKTSGKYCTDDITVTYTKQGTGIKYLYSDIDGEGAWSGISGYEYYSYDYAPLNDNKLRYWIEVDSSDLTFTMPVSVPTYASYRYTGLIDWGDGTEPSVFMYGSLNNTHTYADGGRYVVTAWWTGGSDRFSHNNPDDGDINKILGVELYYKGYPANSILIRNASRLKKVSVSSSQTKTPQILNCPLLESINLPNTIQTVTTMYQNPLLRKLVLPASVTTIEANAFQNNTGMKEYHFLSTTPPTLGNINVFTNIPSDCKIYVPSASLSAYQSATNWSDYATYMVGE